ncbi:Hypothetical protein PEIBARAKI_4449 [Petrimonas sp. IBARAKI]|jgi:hypothetical protein|nr:Hypothetical protein PEIBARAKI_4449 [Petrimonas sp. IBARAKI]
MKKNNVFIISKPLQYFNATNINTIGSKTCLLVNNFYHAQSVFEAIKRESLHWNKVFFFETTEDAYKWVLNNKKKISRLFIDSDYGATKYKILSQIRCIDIFIYEEGIGNYRNKLKEKGWTGTLKEFFYNLFGNKNYLGGSKYVKGIYLYDKDRFKNAHPNSRKPIYEFKVSFSEHLKSFQDKSIFLDQGTRKILSEIKNKKVFLYLTSWSIFLHIDDLLSEYSDYTKIIKPHPHIKKDIDNTFNNFDYVLKGSDIIEIFINELLIKFEEVVIAHHGTSSLMYFRDYPKLKTIVINQK